MQNTPLCTCLSVKHVDLTCELIGCLKKMLSRWTRQNNPSLVLHSFCIALLSAWSYHLRLLKPTRGAPLADQPDPPNSYDCWINHADFCFAPSCFRFSESHLPAAQLSCEQSQRDHFAAKKSPRRKQTVLWKRQVFCFKLEWHISKL